MGLYRIDKKEDELNIGDRVRLKIKNIEGFVTGKDGQDYLVLLNDSAMIEKYTLKELEKIW